MPIRSRSIISSASCSGIFGSLSVGNWEYPTHFWQKLIFFFCLHHFNQILFLLYMIRIRTSERWQLRVNFYCSILLFCVSQWEKSLLEINPGKGNDFQSKEGLGLPRASSRHLLLQGCLEKHELCGKERTDSISWQSFDSREKREFKKKMLKCRHTEI